MNPLISIIHATHKRPKKAYEAMRLWLKNAHAPDRIEYIMVVNETDSSTYSSDQAAESKWGGFVMMSAEVLYSVPAWNVGAMRARGELLIQGQDDVEPPEHWDSELLGRLDNSVGPDWHKEPLVIAVSDGYRKGTHGELMVTAIMSKAYRDMEGHFLFPGYRSMYSDDEFTYRALCHARDKECIFVNARDMVFKHQHHYHVKDEHGKALVSFDETYAKQNSPEAYTHGLRLFNERNPRARDDGIKRW